jgi:hypothetical protein
MQMGFQTLILVFKEDMKLNSKNSSGYDVITNKLIKLSTNNKTINLYNKSLLMEVYHERLKYAVTKPVFKRGGGETRYEQLQTNMYSNWLY